MVLRRTIFLLLALALVAAACGNDDDDSGDAVEAEATEEATAEPEATEEAPAEDEEREAEPTEEAAEPTDDTGLVKPEVEVPDEAPTELVIEDIVVGDGEAAVPGSRLEVHYVGVLQSNGEEFDASYDRGQTFPFVLGQGQVIQGWDEGLEGMQVGGRRQLVIPPELAYGEAGSGGGIGPNEPLVFVVDLVGVETPVDPADEPEVPMPEAAPTELVIEDLVVGEGPAVVAGDEVTIHFVVNTFSDGQTADSTWQQGFPVTFRAGVGDLLIQGWDEGMVGMQAGGQRLIVIPPDLAFGAEGAGAIAPDETLVVLVDLVAIN